MAAGIVAAALCVIVSLRAVSRLSPRALLTAQAIDVPAGGAPGGRRATVLGILFALAGLAMLAAGFASRAAQTGDVLRRGRRVARRVPVPVLVLAALARRPSAVRPRRPAVVAARLPERGVASVAQRPVGRADRVGRVHHRVGGRVPSRSRRIGTDPHSGTGGFTLIGQSEVPLLHNPNDAAGREALGVVNPAAALTRTRVTRFRVRPGEDTSCLNLYRPTNPTIVAPEAAFLDSGRFAFAASLAETDAERANPWLLLRRPAADGVVPVIADATSLQYVLHAAVGDTFSIDNGSDRPLVLRFVAALRDSVLQGELVMAEEHFVRLFPAQQGYRLFLIDAPDARTPAAGHGARRARSSGTSRRSGSTR